MNQKKKGNKTERQVANIMKQWSGWEFSRVPQSGGLRWKKADNIAGDITCTEPNKLCYFSIEVKGYKEINFAHLLYDVKSNIEIFWQQTKEDAKRAKKVPLLFMRYNGLPKDFFFVVMAKKFGKSAFPSLIMFTDYYLFTKDLLIVTSPSLITTDFKKFNKCAKRWMKK